MFRRVRKVWGEDRRGAVVVLVAVAGTMIAGFGAMTIDLGNMYIVRGELQRSVDAAALGAVVKLAKYNRGSSETSAKNEAQRIVEANPVENKITSLDLSRDVQFGQAVWDSTTSKYTFTSGGTVPNAARVTIRKTQDSPNGPMNLMFANVLGIAKKDMYASAAAMLAPRDIVVNTDLSSSMSSDSQLKSYQTRPINLWNIWVCLPIEKGNNGVGNGIDPPPPGNPPLNDGYGTGPGDPGSRGGADPRIDPGLTGPTWGRMYQWGTLLITTAYDPTTDPGLTYLPYNQDWTGDTALRQWYQMVGYSATEINALLSGQFDDTNNGGTWKYRVAVALGLAFWDSGKKNGLWSVLPTAYTSGTRGNSNDKIDPGELAWLVAFPYKDGSQRSDMDYWMDYIDTYMGGTSSQMYQANANFRYRFGLKTFVNYLLENWNTYDKCPDLCKTPQQPLQSLKNALADYMNQLVANESDDQFCLEIYGTTAHKEVGLTKRLVDIPARLKQMQAAHYDPLTNMGDAIGQAITEFSSSRARANATKAIFLISASQPDVTAAGTTSTSGAQAYVLQQVQAAVNKHIQVFCISLGMNANRNLMQQIADMAGTVEYYAGPTITEYSSHLEEICLGLDIKRGPRLIE